MAIHGAALSLVQTQPWALGKGGGARKEGHHVGVSGMANPAGHPTQSFWPGRTRDVLGDGKHGVT